VIDIVCAIHGSSGDLREEQIQKEDLVHRKHLEQISSACKATTNSCKGKPTHRDPSKIEFYACYREANEGCFRCQSEELDRHAESLDQIDEDFPAVSDIRKLCEQTQ
jgi:hypothetical protein